jgi:thioesterase domain-containing protein
MKLDLPLHLLRAETRTGESPIVLIHSINGDASVYEPLARRLAWPGNVIAIEATSPPTSLAQLAADHIKALRDAGLESPWVVGGWAAGGVIAAEMAAQLVDAGDVVRAVAVLDSRVPAPEMRNRPSDDVALAGNFVDQVTRMFGVSVRRRPLRADPDELLAVLDEVGAVPAGWDATETSRRFDIFAATVRAFFRHEPRRVSAPVALFEAQEAHPQHPKPPTLGWEPFAEHLVRTPIPGSHFTLLHEQHATQLATIVDEVLSRVAARGS